jgi:sugar phosphate isomerase/epimerase
MNGVYAMSAITALTAQNTTGVSAIQESTPEFLKQQIDAVFEDIRPDAVKIGMVASSELTRIIAERLRYHDAKNIVVDPVMVATSGSALMKSDAIETLIEELLPLAEEIGFSLNVEYLPRKCIGNCITELENIINRFDPKHVNLCMDVNHVMDKYNELPDIISHLAPRIRTFHFNDYDGIDEKHWFPGQGVINWGAVMKAVRAIDHDVTVIMECTKQLEVFGRLPDPYFALRQTEAAYWYIENYNEIEQRLKEFEIKY